MFQSTDDEQSCMFETFAINNENATTHNTGPTMHYEDKIPPGNSFQSDDIIVFAISKEPNSASYKYLCSKCEIFS